MRTIEITAELPRPTAPAPAAPQPFAAPITSTVVAEHQAQHARLLRDAGMSGLNRDAHVQAANLHGALGAVHAHLDAGDVPLAVRSYAQVEQVATELNERALPGGTRGAVTLALQRAASRLKLARSGGAAVGVEAAHVASYAEASSAPRPAGVPLKDVGTWRERARSFAQAGQEVVLGNGAPERAARGVVRAYAALGAACGEVASGGLSAGTHLDAARASLAGVPPQDLTPDRREAYDAALTGIEKLAAHLDPSSGTALRGTWAQRARTYAAHADALRVPVGLTPAERRPITALADACVALSSGYAQLARGETVNARSYAQSASITVDGAPLAALPPEAQLIRVALVKDAADLQEEALSPRARKYAFEVPVQATEVDRSVPAPAEFVPAPVVVTEADMLLGMRDRLAAASQGARDVATLSALGALSRAFASAYGVVVSEQREDGQAGTYRRRVRMALSGLETSGMVARLPDWALEAMPLAARYG